MPINNFNPHNQVAIAGGYCSICLVPFGQQLVSILPCNHIIHTSCWDNWSFEKFECPVCRQDPRMLSRDASGDENVTSRAWTEEARTVNPNRRESIMLRVHAHMTMYAKSHILYGSINENGQWIFANGEQQYTMAKDRVDELMQDLKSASSEDLSMSHPNAVEYYHNIHVEEAAAVHHQATLTEIKQVCSNRGGTSPMLTSEIDSFRYLAACCIKNTISADLRVTEALFRAPVEEARMNCRGVPGNLRRRMEQLETNIGSERETPGRLTVRRQILQDRVKANSIAERRHRRNLYRKAWLRSDHVLSIVQIQTQLTMAMEERALAQYGIDIMCVYTS